MRCRFVGAFSCIKIELIDTRFKTGLQIQLICKGKQLAGCSIKRHKTHEVDPMHLFHSGFEIGEGVGATATKTQLRQQMRKSVAACVLEARNPDEFRRMRKESSMLHPGDKWFIRF